jgi:hypothetical protein
VRCQSGIRNRASDDRAGERERSGLNLTRAQYKDIEVRDGAVERRRRSDPQSSRDIRGVEKRLLTGGPSTLLTAAMSRQPAAPLRRRGGFVPTTEQTSRLPQLVTLRRDAV